MSSKHLLIIDDEENIRKLLARIMELEGYRIFEAENAKTAFKILEKSDIQVILCDVKLPDANGVELTTKIKAQFPHIEVIVLTAFGTIADGVRAVKNGAFDYITKGDDNNKIIPIVSMAMDKALLKQKAVQFESAQAQKSSFGSIIGESIVIFRAIELARKVAVTNATVLLLGETGTGKEVFAQTIHNESQRKAQAFVAINCSTLGKDILESELFGHKAGAFTGAVRDKKGLFEEATGGTIFLDEIGEMPFDLQAKLLRVLETGAFMKVGETKETKADVRIIAATNRDLQKESEEGGFRADLFYRLSVFQINLPSLAERPEDIPLLATHFLHHFAVKTNKPVTGISAEFLQALKIHRWKGNIRELKNVVERAVILADGPQLTVDSLPVEFNMHQNFGIVGAFEMAVIEKHHIRKVMTHTQGNKVEAARLLNIGLTTLYRKLEEYAIH